MKGIIYNDTNKPRETIREFDKFLKTKGLSFEAIVIGGAALGLLGVVSRQTRDCDVLHPELPESIKSAAREFAQKRNKIGDLLAEDWLNNGPSSLADVLPAGWIVGRARCQSGLARTYSRCHCKLKK